MRSAAELVRQARLLVGYSRGELARAADVAPSTVGRIEKGEVDPSWSLLASLLAAAGYRLEDSLTSLADIDAVDAAINALSSEPTLRTDGWSAGWRRAGLLDEQGRAKDPSRLAAAAGLASDLRSRPGARMFLLDRDVTELTTYLERAGASPMFTGPIVFGDLDPSGVAAYVRDPDELNLPPAKFYQPSFAALPAPEGLRRRRTSSGLPVVSPERALIDSFASGGRVADRAEAYASRLRAA